MCSHETARIGSSRYYVVCHCLRLAVGAVGWIGRCGDRGDRLDIHRAVTSPITYLSSLFAIQNLLAMVIHVRLCSRKSD